MSFLKEFIIPCIIVGLGYFLAPLTGFEWPKSDTKEFWGIMIFAVCYGIGCSVGERYRCKRKQEKEKLIARLETEVDVIKRVKKDFEEIEKRLPGKH